jgi:hypothetical protein
VIKLNPKQTKGISNLFQFKSLRESKETPNFETSNSLFMGEVSSKCKQEAFVKCHPYGRIYDKPSKKNIMNKNIMDITLSNTIGMDIVKKRKIKCLHVLVYGIHNGSNLAKSTR